MGFCSSASADDAFQSGHQQHAPMWVVRVGHVLEMTGRLPPHQSLKAKGLLSQWSPEMFVIFVSHQWLGRQHPDPMGEQLLVLQGVLKNIISRKLKIESDIVSQYYGRRPTKGELRRTAKAHVWLDYFSVPQLVDGHEPGVPEEQLLHVRSIPSYVDCCNIFLALVPDATHSETLSQCNFHSWLERGWCRTELWSYSLSARSKIPIVVVKSQDVAQFAAPLWHRYPVHLGDFAVEKDRASCSTVIQTALTEHLGELSQVKNKTAYRLYRSLFEEMTGLARKQRSLEEFLSDFSFSNHLHRHKGLGPIACAALSGDHVLVHTLAVAKASLQTSAPALPQTLNASGYSPLHLAVWFRSHDLRMLETLLKLRADPSSSSLTALPPLGLCSTVEALELLVRHGAGINDQGKHLTQYCPLHVAASFGAPCQVLARMVELKADVLGGRGGLASASPLHPLAFSGDSNNNLLSAQLLLQSRADMNQVCQPEGISRSVELILRAYNRCCRGEPNALLRFVTNNSTTPVGWSVIFDNEGLLTLLLAARADPELRNHRGLRPIDFARSERMRAILRDPQPHVYLLEHHSELISRHV
ncbi:unnamed protein product [Durusdinium trenchii]|uniref:Uncharacterized protein n=2 Tax=Durusdinium trenchii TaxID=1381693 RepID=A0ABP0K503_9DINO